MSRRGATIAAVALLLAGLLAAGTWWWARAARPVDPERGVRIRMRLDGARESVRLVQEDDRLLFLVDAEGVTLRLAPEQLAERLYRQEVDRSWIEELLNISSPIGIAWVALGLLGQFLFTGRMVVQWLHSERVGRSEVPPVFWWLSLGGAAMLLTYFTWRMDIVGVIGQSLGFVIYFRNIVLIRNDGRRSATEVAVTQDPLDEELVAADSDQPERRPH